MLVFKAFEEILEDVPQWAQLVIVRNSFNRPAVRLFLEENGSRKPMIGLARALVVAGWES
jgi:hypothetical protein